MEGHGRPWKDWLENLVKQLLRKEALKLDVHMLKSSTSDFADFSFSLSVLPKISNRSKNQFPGAEIILYWVVQRPGTFLEKLSG